MAIALKYDLQAQGSYVQGKPINIEFALENLSAREVWVLKWYTPLEGIKGKIFEVKCDGVDVPYKGRMVKRGNPGPDDYVRIGPGESARAEFDLSNAYALPVCKECRVSFKGPIHDAVLNQQQVPRAVEEHVPVDVAGNAVSFSIT